MWNCKICGQYHNKPELTFKNIPVSHHYQSSSDNFYLDDILFSQCKECGTFQICKDYPVEELRPKFDWLTCTEPEEHLDELVDKLSKLEGINDSSKILGVSFKEDTTLERFNINGFLHTNRLDEDSLEINQINYSVETVQEKLTVDAANKYTEKNGVSDMVIARHIIEHANKPNEFMNACKVLVDYNGYIVFEIPDCEFALKNYDYTMIWEEHTLYFTPATFRQFFEFHQLEIVFFQTIPYLQEKSHIIVARCTNKLNTEASKLIRKNEKYDYCAQYEFKKNNLKKYLHFIKSKFGSIALFGAGHMGCMFVNIMELESIIDFVIDDNSNLKDKYLPGTKLRIVSSDYLNNKDIKFCLTSISESGLIKVLKENHSFMKNGGVFRSIFPGSHIALDYKENYEVS